MPLVKNKTFSLTWWHIPVIPVNQKAEGQDDPKFKVRLSNLVASCLKIK